MLLRQQTTNVFIPRIASLNHASYIEGDVNALLNSRGLLARLFRPMFRLVTRSWHMLPLGSLFGLSFDTATEISLLGIAATEAAKDVPLSAIMVSPRCSPPAWRWSTRRMAC